MDVDSDPPIAVDDGPFVEEYEGAAKEYWTGVTFMSEFDRDQHAGRVENLYYPFASKDERELAAFLPRSDLSTTSIDALLSLKLVSVRHSYCHFCLSNFHAG